jgi:hypothetical protein
LAAVILQSQGDAAGVGRGDIGRGRLAGPVEDGTKTAALEAHALVAEQACESVGASVGDLLRGQEVPCDGPGTVVLPEIAEGIGEAREVSVEVVADLTTETGGLVDETAAEACEAQECGPEFVAGGLGEGEAVEGSAVHGEEVAVVGLVVGISDLAELFSSEWVDNAGVEGRGAEGALDEAMVAAGSFNDDEQVLEVVVVHGLAELSDRVGEAGAVVDEALRLEEEGAEEVGKHPLGIVFVAIKAGEAEVAGTGSFDAIVEVTAGLVEGIEGASRVGSSRALVKHGKPPRSG